MSSIINAYRNIISDSSWFLKILVMAVPIFIVLNFSLGNQIMNNETQITLLITVLLLYVGVGTYIMNRNISNVSPILPNLFGIPDLLVCSLVSAFIIAPGTIACLAVMKLISLNLSYELPLMILIYSLTVIFFTPFIFIPLCLYAADKKIMDALNLKPLIEGGGNFIVAVLGFIIQYAFTIAVCWVLLYIVFNNMMTEPLLVNIVHSFFTVLSLLTFFSYVSDQFGEAIPDQRKKDKYLF